MDHAGRERAEQSIAHASLTAAAVQLGARIATEARSVFARVCRRCSATIAASPGRSRPNFSPPGTFQPLPHISERSLVEPESYDYLAAAMRLSWAMDPSGVYDLLNEAHDRALAEKRFHFAVGARDRLAHHALLFGDVEIARNALEDALRLALLHRLLEWFSRCSAAAARLALDTGDSERAGQLLARAKPHARDSDALALLAPVGAAVAIEAGDEASLEEWTSQAILETALYSEALPSAIAATTALLTTQLSTLDAAVSTALQRALLQAAGASMAVELFTLAARYGEIEEARAGAQSLEALVAPNRKYIKAHALLAKAHLLFRGGERSAWIDQAGDAARAFNAMGLRRWMNEAMLLLVRQESDNFPRRRGRPVGSALTGREQQVAHLIRRGARNREVATALQISEHTVERHVSSILGRLGLRSRWQIADPKNGSED